MTMTRENKQILKEKGWYTTEELKAASKLTLKDIEEREANETAHEVNRIEKLYSEGKLDLDKPCVCSIYLYHWTLKRFGLTFTVNYLKEVVFKNPISEDMQKSDIKRILKMINVSESDVETALNPVKEVPAEFKKKPVKKINKSSVCSIANKISRSISRKDAFITAWQIVKNGGYEVRVSGVSFENRQEALKRLTTYNPKDIHAVLVPEFDNPFDNNAISVQVMVNGGRGIYRLGYVPKKETAIVRAFIGSVPELKVLDGDLRGAKLRMAV